MVQRRRRQQQQEQPVHVGKKGGKKGQAVTKILASL